MELLLIRYFLSRKAWPGRYLALSRAVGAQPTSFRCIPGNGIAPAVEALLDPLRAEDPSESFRKGRLGS